MFNGLDRAPRDAFAAFVFGMAFLAIAVLTLAGVLGILALDAFTPLSVHRSAVDALTLVALAYALAGALSGVYYESRVMTAAYDTEPRWFGE